MSSTYDLAPRDVAKILHVHPQTIKHWARAGTLPGIRTPGGHWRFSRAGIAAFIDAQRNTGPAA